MASFNLNDNIKFQLLNPVRKFLPTILRSNEKYTESIRRRATGRMTTDTSTCKHGNSCGCSVRI